MSEKKKQEYTTGGLKNRQDVENALASAEYRPSQEVTDAASDLKQWQANRPGDYESAYQGRIDGLMEDLLDRKEFSYSYGADPLYRQYAQLYTQNAQNASADAAAQAAAPIFISRKGGRIMATLKSVIDYVDEIKPNAFSNEAKTKWLNECEGLVQTEVLLWASEEIITYQYDADKDKELLAQPPHDKIYWAYLTAMIDFANGEYNKYQNTMQMFNSFFGEFMRWFALNYRPADTHEEVYV